MNRRSASERPWARIELQAAVLALMLLPLPARAGQLALRGVALPAGLALLLALAWCWGWLSEQRRARRQAEVGWRRSETELAEARRHGQDWQACCEQLTRDLRQAVDERDRLAGVLVEREQSLARHLECSSELIFELDLDGRCLQISPNWRDVLGIDPDSLLGQSHAWMLHPDDQPACQRAIERALVSRRLQCEVEYRIRHAGGDWRWHAARIAPRLDARGRAVGLIGCARQLGSELRGATKAARRAHFDALTELPGPGLCRDRLRQALSLAERHGDRTALLCIDLDGFAALNRRWGHAVGDLVLCETAARLSACVRASDTVGRGQADTFTVLLPDVGSEREALAVAQQIRQALSAPLLLRGQRLALTACVGVALHPAHGSDEDELGERAALAVRRAKDGGGDWVALPDRLVPGPVLVEPVCEALQA